MSMIDLLGCQERGALDRVKELVDRSASRWGVDTATIYGKRRYRAAAFARQHAWRLIREDPITRHYSLTDIGRMFGRDHTTVLHGIRNDRARNPAQEVV